ncbi:Zinc finger protein 347 [Labeo rohita]|uniref:Zinc finger protein 347 n=1 Tax=Labeo rohita TaxID=84645 RepID=A0ABQ8L0L4_LABRO|nr:Zinc finger protein 347 [Labeo rohita]
MPKVQKVVLENVEKVREKVRKTKALQGQVDRFEVGDKVLHKNVREEQQKGPRLPPKWPKNGPTMIIPFQCPPTCPVESKETQQVPLCSTLMQVQYIINAYLTSLVKQYTTDFKKGFVVDSHQMANTWSGAEEATNCGFIQHFRLSNHHRRLPKDIIQRTRQPIRSGMIPSAKTRPSRKTPLFSLNASKTRSP